jgi:hypothetical protein
MVALQFHDNQDGHTDLESALLNISGSKMIPAVSNDRAPFTSMLALGISTT